MFISINSRGDNLKIWVYIKVPDEKKEEFIKITSDPYPFNMQEYGEVLVWGWGAKPPRRVVNEIKGTLIERLKNIFSLDWLNSKFRLFIKRTRQKFKRIKCYYLYYIKKGV